MGKEIVAGPVLKWAGSKMRLIKQIRQYLPVQPKKFYVEPFVGGGALLFWMLNHYGDHFEEIIVNDHNPDLILMYQAIQNSVETLIAELESLVQEFRNSKDPAEFYLARREEYNSKSCTDGIRRSALLIFLNRTCFNGLYRVNLKGEFNVPFGKRPDAVIYVPEILRKDSETLKGVRFMCGDYARALAPEFDQDKAFYYFDPPYRPLNPTSNFTRYTKETFGEFEQIELAAHCKRLDDVGALVMVSNADTTIYNPHDTFYKDHFPRKRFFHFTVMAPRLVNANPFKRGPIPEVLITNYKPAKR